MVELVRIDTMAAYDKIKEKIILLQLPPGAPIDEGALAEELNLASSAVREALKLLVHDNLVTVTTRHGIRVAEANPADLRQLFEMRLPMESMCARFAAERATPDDIAVMEALGREYESAREKRDVAHLLDLDHRYHRSLTDAAHNRYMKETLERFFGLSERLWYLAMPEIDWLIAALDRHKEMVNAIKVRDGDKAAELMAEHVLDFQKHVEQALNASG